MTLEKLFFDKQNKWFAIAPSTQKHYDTRYRATLINN